MLYPTDLKYSKSHEWVKMEDGVAVIARHMNYGLYRVEGRSDCPRDALNICRMLSLKPEILEKIEQSY